MKMAIALTLFMVTSSIYATDVDPDDCQNCRTLIQVAPQPLNPNDQNLAENLSNAVMSSAERVAFNHFTASLCNEIDRGGTEVSFSENIKKVFKNYYSELNKTEPTDPQEKIKTRLMFLNDHKNEIICSSSLKCEFDNSLCKDGMQYMKYALYTGNYNPLLRGVLTGSLVPDDGDVLIDFNAITYNEDGKPETLLDYIKRELVRPEYKIKEPKSLNFTTKLNSRLNYTNEPVFKFWIDNIYNNPKWEGMKLIFTDLKSLRKENFMPWLVSLDKRFEGCTIPDVNITNTHRQKKVVIKAFYEAKLLGKYLNYERLDDYEFNVKTKVDHWYYLWSMIKNSKYYKKI